jgi:RNA polymerase sigma factor (sigma-70 family)
MASMTSNGCTTDPKLLERVRDWQDGPAWCRFVSNYEPALRAVCRHFGLTGHSADDCCQQVWIKLASAMRRFHYDPGRRFRSWIRCYFHSRVMDVLRSSGGDRATAPLTDDVAREPCRADEEYGEPCDPEILAMLRRAVAVQEAVSGRVTPDNWEAFRLIAIEGMPVPDAAALLGREYTTIYRAYKRVSRMIAEERHRREGIADEATLQA